jgi:EVE domain
MKFWVAVARNEAESDERLKRTSAGDRVVFYSPRPKQSFTSIGELAGSALNVLSRGEVPVKPLLESLDFIRDKKQWGVFFRRGFFEVSEKDFQTIESAMVRLP